jgi:hypothetical protein
MAQKVRFYRVCGALVIGLLLNTMLFFGEVRFRAPLDPLLFILLAVGVGGLIVEIKHKHPQPDDTSSQRW